MKFSPEESGHFRLLGVRDFGYFRHGCWGRLTGTGVFLGLSLPTNATEETFQAFAQSQLLQLRMGDCLAVERRLARGR